ncbi:hypothetical protein QBC44DRAFT_363717 [Cladorrhinum sp. PSN332]|nr:hypothetical protein QBC44DRAFT_363717 [Cladorrhinum sp. PSN332]
MRFAIITPIVLASMLQLAAATPTPEKVADGHYKILDDGTKVLVPAEFFRQVNETDVENAALESRPTGTQRGYFYSSDCGGGDYFQWNGGTRCYEHWWGGVRVDLYSVYVGGNAGTHVYNNPGCSNSGGSNGGFSHNRCWNRFGNPIRSFFVKY